MAPVPAPASTVTIKVAPPNPHTSKFPRLTHQISLAGGRDFERSKVEFGLQVRPAGDKYPAIRVNTEFWRLRYTLEVDYRMVGEEVFKDPSLRLSEKLAAWQAERKGRNVAIAGLSLIEGRSLSAALRDVRNHGERYALECTMATALVRLFVVRRGVIGTAARFEDTQEADRYFDEIHPAVSVTPLKGDVHVPGLKWLDGDAPPVALADLRTRGELATKDGKHKVKPGDWIHFKHPFLGDDDPFGGENALWMGRGMVYAHDYGLVSVDHYLAAVHQHDTKFSLNRVRGETVVSLQMVGL